MNWPGTIFEKPAVGRWAAIVLAVAALVADPPPAAAEDFTRIQDHGAWDIERAFVELERLRMEIRRLSGLAGAQAELLAWRGSGFPGWVPGGDRSAAEGPCHPPLPGGARLHGEPPPGRRRRRRSGLVRAWRALVLLCAAVVSGCAMPAPEPPAAPAPRGPIRPRRA